MNNKTNAQYRRYAGQGTNSSATITSLMQMAVLSTAVAITLTSCQSFSSDAVTDDNVNVQSGIGLLYYLPQGRVHIVGSLSGGTGNGGDGAGTPTPAPAADTNAIPDQSTPDLSQAQPVATNIAARPKAPAAPAAPVKPVVNGGGQGSSQATYTIQITGDIIADPTTNYLLSPAHNYISDDASHLVVSGKGLLSSTAATNTDETAAIFTNLVQLISMAGGLNGAPPPTIVPFDVYFDPNTPSDISRANDVIRQASNNKLTLNVTSIAASRHSDFKLPTQHDGILYRRLIPYHVSVNGTLTSTFSIDAQQDVLLPDKKTLFAMDYNRMSFVQKVETVSFTNGVPIEYSENVPSPVLGLMSIPKAILQALLPIPGGTPAATGVATKSTTASK